jgi:type I restriction enzyme, S subunit
MSEMVPDGWASKKFSEIVTLQYGKSPQNILDEDGEIPIWGTGGITGFANSYIHDGESIVIGRKGTIDKPNYVTGRFWAIDTTYYIDDFKNCYSKWFYYNLLVTNLKKFNEATGVPSLNRETLYNISTIIPPLPEQQKIASILTSVDTVIEKTEAQINKLKDLKKAMMQELLTKGIGHTEFKDSPVGRIPKSWEVVELREVTLKIADRDHTTPKYVDEGVPIISPTNLNNDGELDLTKLKLITKEAHKVNQKKTDLKPRDIIFSRIGAGLGKPYLVKEQFWDFSILHSLCQIRTNERVLPEFLTWFLKSDFLQNRILFGIQSIGVPDLGLKEIGNLLIILPSNINEQHNISNRLESIYALIKKKRKYLSKTKSLKKALMQDLLTGKVRVKV